MMNTNNILDDSITLDLSLYKAQVDALLEPRVYAACTDTYMAEEIVHAMLPGRRLRPFLFKETLLGLGGQMTVRNIDVMLAIELVHTASILVDDILDRDDIRHGLAVVERQWGPDKAILFSHGMVGIAIDLLSFDHHIQKQCVSMYRRMVEGELYDTLYPPGQWLYEGYDIRTYRKTSSLFGFVLTVAGQLSGMSTGSIEFLSHFGQELGRFYQLSNDYYDWQPRNLDRRKISATEWPITYSYPLATYLHLHSDRGIHQLLSQGTLNRIEWQTFLQSIWTPDVTNICDKEIDKQKEHLDDLLQTSDIPIRLRQFYFRIVEFISRESCWYSKK